MLLREFPIDYCISLYATCLFNYIIEIVECSFKIRISRILCAKRDSIENLRQMNDQAEFEVEILFLIYCV